MSAVTDRLRSALMNGSVETVDMSPYDVFDLLSVERRCLVIDAIGEHGHLSASDLSEVVAALEYGPDYDRKERKRVYISLKQHNMEPLLEYGVIQTVGKRVYGPGPNFEGVADVLASVREVCR